MLKVFLFLECVFISFAQILIIKNCAPSYVWGVSVDLLLLLICTDFWWLDNCRTIVALLLVSYGAQPTAIVSQRTSTMLLFLIVPTWVALISWPTLKHGVHTVPSVLYVVIAPLAIFTAFEIPAGPSSHCMVWQCKFVLDRWRWQPILHIECFFFLHHWPVYCWTVFSWPHLYSVADDKQ